MVKFLASFLVTVALAPLGHAQSPQLPGWKLVWSDEFNYTGHPDPAKWGYEEGYVPPEDPSSDYRMANQALDDLLASSLGHTLPRLPWKVQILQSWGVNAYSSSGVISVTRGLGWVLGNHEGLWAAAIAHEMAHSVMLNPSCQQQFEAELRRAYFAAGGNPDDPQAARDLRVTPARGGVLHLSGQRAAEYEADRLGLLLMAEAGFHPDFAIALDRRMLSTIGQDARFSEFLASHPIWSNREQQNERDEAVPLAIFAKDWPDARRSPGGAPPPFGKVRSVKVTGDAAALMMDVKFEMRNVGGRQARVAAILLDRNRVVRSSRPEYRAPDGRLAVNAMLPGFHDGPGEATVRIPRNAIESGDAKLRATIFLVAGDWTLDLWFQPLASVARAPMK